MQVYFHMAVIVAYVNKNESEACSYVPHREKQEAIQYYTTPVVARTFALTSLETFSALPLTILYIYIGATGFKCFKIKKNPTIFQPHPLFADHHTTD